MRSEFERERKGGRGMMRMMRKERKERKEGGGKGRGIVDSKRGGC